MVPPNLSHVGDRQTETDTLTGSLRDSSTLLFCQVSILSLFHFYSQNGGGPNIPPGKTLSVLGKFHAKCYFIQLSRHPIRKVLLLYCTFEESKGHKANEQHE